MTFNLDLVGWMKKDRRSQGGSHGDEPIDVAQAVASSPSLLKLQQRGTGNK